MQITPPQHTVATVNLISAEPKVPAVFDFHIEALRGIAALLVVLSHVLTNEFHLDPGYRLTGIELYSTPGHLSVLIFFILSGYVIGLTNKVPIVTNLQRYQYLKKRFVRLYPLYFIAVLFAVTVALYTQQPIKLIQVGWHLVFGQVLFTEVLYANQPLWSLSYEVTYYLLFLLLSAYQWQPVTIAIICALIGICNKFVPGFPPVVTSYSYGACFWLLGLFMSKLPRRNQPVQFGVLLAFILLMLCYDRLDIFYRSLIHVNMNFTEQEVHSFFQRAITFADFSLLLFCWPLLLRFTNRYSTGILWLERLIFCSPGIYLIGQLIARRGHYIEFFEPLTGFIVLYICSMIVYLSQTYWSKFSEYLLNKAVPLGSISYGVYIIHFPILLLFQRVGVVSGSLLTFVLRLFLFMF
ncbi:MAG: acyltransferase, partial [Hymenobacter sp.]